MVRFLLLELHHFTQVGVRPPAGCSVMEERGRELGQPLFQDARRRGARDSSSQRRWLRLSMCLRETSLSPYPVLFPSSRRVRVDQMLPLPQIHMLTSRTPTEPLHWSLGNDQAMRMEPSEETSERSLPLGHVRTQQEDGHSPRTQQKPCAGTLALDSLASKMVRSDGPFS